MQRLFSFAPQWYPHSLAVAVKAKNSPPDCFLYAFTVLKEIIFVILAFYSLCSLQRLFSFAPQWYPHSLAVAVKAKNSPPDCFLYAFTVLKEIIFVILAFYSLCSLQRLFSFAPQWYPHSLAVAVKAKNSPPDCFLYAFTVLKEIIFVILAFYSLCNLQRLFSFASQWYPHSLAVAVKAKNSPPDCFLYAFTVLKEIIFVILAFYSLCKFARAVLFY
ncbi:hypothetical protein [Ruminococcus sp.]|uniref:hypothetical protein n=1 Tax=Ruminococcus sp. TaxID=41978 RepID=UPI003521631C